MYIAPEQGQTTPWGQNFDVNRNSLSLCPFVVSLKKISLKSDFLPFFYVFFFHMYMYIALGRDRQSIGDKILMTTKRPFIFAHMLQVSKWSLRNLILYTFLMILYMYIALGQGQKTPWGQTFDVNRKPLSLWPFVASFKQMSLNSDFIHIFFTQFFHMYIAPWQGQTTLCGQNPDVNRKALSLCPFVASFKKNIFEVWFYT